MQWLLLLALGALTLKKKKKPTLAERAGSKAKVQSAKRIDAAEAEALKQASIALGKTDAEKRGDE